VYEVRCPELAIKVVVAELLKGIHLPIVHQKRDVTARAFVKKEIDKVTFKTT
jgi:hypothetical protein